MGGWHLEAPLVPILYPGSNGAYKRGAWVLWSAQEQRPYYRDNADLVRILYFGSNEAAPRVASVLWSAQECSAEAVFLRQNEFYPMSQRSFGRLLTEKVSLSMYHTNLKYEYAHVKFNRLLALFDYLFRMFMSFGVKVMMHNAHTMNSMKLLHSLVRDALRIEVV